MQDEASGLITGSAMATVHDHIRALECFLAVSGVRLVRTPLPPAVHGRTHSDLITLSADLSPLQELLALVHELAHWLAHREAGAAGHRTVFEYEAEAVEALVMARLGICESGGQLDWDGLTDDLLPASVTRVNWASDCICRALGIEA